MKAYFLSDLHIHSSEDPKAQKLVGLLSRWRTKDDITHLFLLGDIFDLWVAGHVYFQNKFAPVIAELRRLKSIGVEIHYFEGNHDLYLEHFFARKLDIAVYDSFEYFHFPGALVRMEHGDEMDPSDIGYRFLRWFLRTPLMKFVAPRLPGFFVAWLGEQVSKASRKYTSEYKVLTPQRAVEVIHAHARRAWKETPFDVLICGHVHVVEDYHFRPDSARESRVINLGAWFGGARVLYYDGKEWHMVDV